MTDEHAIPASAEGYQALLPTDPDIPAGVTINTADPRYKDAATRAHKAGLSQGQFAAMLAIEARRVIAARKSASPSSAPAPPPSNTPAPKPAPAPTPYKNLTFAQKLAAGGHVTR